MEYQWKQSQWMWQQAQWQEKYNRRHQNQAQWQTSKSDILKENKIVQALKPYILTSEQLKKYGYPVETTQGCVMINYTQYPTLKHSSHHSTDSQQKVCVRCHIFFNISYKERCVHHWGKLWYDNKKYGTYWTCCHKTELENGCAIGETHIHIGLKVGPNGPLAGFINTKSKKHTQKMLRIAAIDCEMCFTEDGLEVTKVTILNLHGETIYETFIKPLKNIIDFNTRFSGIREEDMQNVTNTLQTVQHELLEFISAETILIGHGMENDLRALRLLHEQIIDTAIVFPHYKGFPYRRSLKNLSENILKRNIQKETHDSAEDAKAAIDLMIKKISADETEPFTSGIV